MNDALRKKLTAQQGQIEAAKGEILKAVFKKAKGALDENDREAILYYEGILTGIRLLTKELKNQIEAEKQKGGRNNG